MATALRCGLTRIRSLALIRGVDALLLLSTRVRSESNNPKKCCRSTVAEILSSGQVVLYNVSMTALCAYSKHVTTRQAARVEAVLECAAVLLAPAIGAGWQGSCAGTDGCELSLSLSLTPSLDDQNESADELAPPPCIPAAAVHEQGWPGAHEVSRQSVKNHSPRELT